MLDLYEIKYGYVNSAMADPEPGASASNVVNGQGWQNPLIYNARYGMVIIGGSTKGVYEEKGNYPAFWNDGMGLYSKLVTDYNYLDKNVYVLHSYWGTGVNHASDSRVDSPSTREDIKNAFNILKYKITINDFFFCCIIAHGGPDSFDNAPLLPNDKEFCWYGYGEGTSKYNLSEGVDNLFFARTCIVIQSCESEGALDDIGKPERIIIVTARTGEDCWTAQGTNAEHWAFLWGIPGYDGFTPSLGSLASPNSTYYAFGQGSATAQSNAKPSVPLIGDWTVGGAGNTYL